MYTMEKEVSASAVVELCGKLKVFVSFLLRQTLDSGNLNSLSFCFQHFPKKFQSINNWN